MAAPINGKKLLALENMNMPNPAINHTTDSLSCFVIFFIQMYFSKYAAQLFFVAKDSLIFIAANETVEKPFYEMILVSAK